MRLVAGDRLGDECDGDEVQCGPFGGILDRGSHADRAEGLQPDRVAVGKLESRWPGGVSPPQSRDEALGVVPVFVRYGSPSTGASE
jgi:hypothetical protein